MARQVYEGSVLISLLKPVKYEDKTYTEVKLDFSKATAKMIMNAESETFGNGNVSTVIRNLSSEFNARLAASLSGVRFEAIQKMNPADFDAIWQTVAAYTNNQDPEEFYKQFVGADEDEIDEDAEDETDEDNGPVASKGSLENFQYPARPPED